MDLAAAKVSHLGTQGASSDDVVELSAEARAAATNDGFVTGIEQALTDQRVAKYAAIANMRSLQTADEVSKTTTKMLSRGA